ncbi:hypothetical protein DXB41_01825 [Segatella copri]|nr:hypothetical protein DXB41_01825 [Segatella copri]
MLYQAHRLQILQRIDSVLERYSKIAEMRYKAGESRQLEYLSADRKCNENRLEMADVKSEIERLQIDLMSQLNTQEPVKPAEENLSAIAARISIPIIISSLPTVFTSRISSSLSIRKSRQPRRVLLRVYPYLCAPNVSFPVGIHTT